MLDLTNILFLELLTGKETPTTFDRLAECLHADNKEQEAALLRLHNMCFLLPEGDKKQDLAKTVRCLMYDLNIRYPYPIYKNSFGIKLTRIPGLPILMGIYPITQKEWESVMGNNPSHFKGENNPVEMVSWHTCNEFCNKLTEKENKKYRLPTEKEWEYACKAGLGESPFTYGNSLEGFANIKFNRTIPVGNYPSNPWGLYDMHGNVWEWCQELFSDNTTDRVLHGGFWASFERGGYIKHRQSICPHGISSTIGLRIVMEI